jgi:hypothetical protein
VPVDLAIVDLWHSTSLGCRIDVGHCG